jgi:hypothetical protein
MRNNSSTACKEPHIIALDRNMNARNVPNYVPPDLDLETIKQYIKVKHVMFVKLVTNTFVLVESCIAMKLHTGLDDHIFAMFVVRHTNPMGI